MREFLSLPAMRIRVLAAALLVISLSGCSHWHKSQLYDFLIGGVRISVQDELAGSIEDPNRFWCGKFKLWRSDSPIVSLKYDYGVERTEKLINFAIALRRKHGLPELECGGVEP